MTAEAGGNGPLRSGAGWIRVEGVTKSYQLLGGRRHVALSNITLSVEPGEFACIVGPSGCGKSTLLFVMGGLLKPDRGRVTLGAMRAATVFQEPRLLPWRTVRQNVAFALHDLPREQARARTEEVIRLVGLEDAADRFPGQLSGGMQQRASIARALAPDPQVLLMDEPFSALDEMTARRLRVELLAIWERLRTTVVFVTHNALEASYLADRVVVMRPSCIASEMKVPLVRPRRYDDPHLFETYHGLIRELDETGRTPVVTKEG